MYIEAKQAQSWRYSDEALLNHDIKPDLKNRNDKVE
jgi:hypothetical protein